MKLAFCALLLGQWSYPAGEAYLCGPPVTHTHPTLGQRCARAQVIVYGTLANPRLLDQQSQDGVTDLQVEGVLKSPNNMRAALTKTKLIELPRYVPKIRLDKSPRHVVFFKLADGKLEPIANNEVLAEPLLEYLKELDALTGKDRAEALRFYARHLDHPDSVIAFDALVELERSAPQAFFMAPKFLSANRLRTLVADARADLRQRGLAAFLLSAFGEPNDARMIRSMIDEKSREASAMLDSLLLAYIHLKPLESWALAFRIATDSSLLRRFAAIRVYRYMYAWKPSESHGEMLRAFRVLIDQKDMADVPIDQLRRWANWDLTDQVLANYDKPGFESNIVRRMIIRYALCCPLPETRRFIERVRRHDPEAVGDIEESLDLKNN